MIIIFLLTRHLDPKYNVACINPVKRLYNNTIKYLWMCYSATCCRIRTHCVFFVRGLLGCSPPLPYPVCRPHSINVSTSRTGVIPHTISDDSFLGNVIGPAIQVTDSVHFLRWSGRKGVALNILLSMSN